MNNDWQSMETAPKDGSFILMYHPTAPAWGQVTIGKWETQEFNRQPKPFWDMWFRIGGRMDAREWVPTHWMPLPEAPSQGEKA